MAYTIRPLDGTPLAQITRALQKKLVKDKRFTVAEITEHGVRKLELHLAGVRLTKAKPYCGQHPGPCRLLGQKKRSYKYLEWDDWVSFHALVNDVLDAMHASADVFTKPQDARGRMFIRRGAKRRLRYEWKTGLGRFGGEVQVWNLGTPDQFELTLVEA